jgi:hypothetical protein
MSIEKRSVRNDVMAELVILFSLLFTIILFSSSICPLSSSSYEIEADSSKAQQYWLQKAV